MNKKIKIVTGNIQSGKTTGLFKFANTKKSIDGILAPIVNEKRRLYHISSRTIKEFEVDQLEKGTVSVGKYNFLNDSFRWANEKLIESYSQSPEWLIIDEIGKLELEGKGLDKATKHILNRRSNSKTTIILVIRNYLLKEALTKYDISEDEYEIMEL